MAQKEVAAHKTIGRGFTNEIQTVKLTWDHALDGGATTDTYVMGTSLGKILILDACVHVETAATSGGSATLAIGLAGGDVDAFLDASSGAVAALVLNYTEKEAAGQKLIIPANGKMEAVIATAAMTAGKVSLIISFVNAA